MGLHKKKIDDWKERDKKVVETRSVQQLKQMLQEENVVTVIGPSGSGKSTSMHHVVLFLEKYYDFMIVPVHSPSDILLYHQPTTLQVFVIDDVCGKYSIDLQKVKDWETLSEDLTLVFKNNANIKLVMSCRSHIFQNRHFKVVKLLSRSNCNIISADISLTYEERQRIAKMYLTSDETRDIEEIIKVTKFDSFPLLCEYYSKNKSKDIKTFFSTPNEIIKKDLECMMNDVDQTNYAVLALLVIYNNNISEDMLQKKTEIKKAVKEIQEECDPPIYIPIKALKNRLENLTNSYLKKDENKYSVFHDKIFTILVSFYGEHMFDLILKLSHTDIIRDHYQFKSLNEIEDDCIITVPVEREKCYFERLYDDIKHGSILNVFRNRQLQFISYRGSFMKFLEGKTDIYDYIQSVSNTVNSPLLTLADADVIQMLLKLGLDKNVRDESGRTPLWLSCMRGNEAVVNVMLRHNCGANICDNKNSSPLYIAACKGNENIVQQLLGYNCDPDLDNIDKRTPLLIAASEGNDIIVKLLLKHKCNPNKVDKDGVTPLLVATRWGRKHIVELLLEHGCDPNICGKDKNPPLHVALSEGYTEIVKILLNFKCDPNIVNKNKEPSLYVAANNADTSLLQVLLENSSFDIDVFTATMLSAITKGQTDVVKQLLKCKCFPPLHDKLSVLGIATYLEEKDIVKILLQHNFHLGISLENAHIDSNILKWMSSKLKTISSHQESLFSNQNISLGNIPSRSSRLEFILIEYQEGSFFNSIEINFPLHEASRNCNLEIVKLFIDFNFNPFTFNTRDESSVLVAVQKGHIKIVECLLQSKHIPHHNDSSVFEACVLRNISLVNKMLKKKFNPNVCSINGLSPLFQASTNGDTDLVKLLLKNKSDFNQYTKRNETPLYIACRYGHSNIVMLLLNHCSDFYKRNKDYKSPLSVASSEGYTTNVKYFLEYEYYINFCNEYNETPLFIASCYGHTEIVKLLLKTKGCDPNISNKEGKTPLNVAAAFGRKEVVKVLLRYRCDANVCDSNKRSALYNATLKGYTAIVKMLLEHNCNPDLCNNENKSPLLVATRLGFTDIVKLLLVHNCNTNIVDRDMISASHEAVAVNSKDIEKLSLGIESNIRDNFQNSALYIACRYGRSDIVKLLLQSKCNPDLCNKDNESPLYAACCFGYDDIVLSLLEHGCDLNKSNKDNKSPLYVALSKGYITIVKYLLEYKCDFNLCNKDDEHPLFIASFNGHVENVELLLKTKSCDPNISNKEGKTPLNVAAAFGRKEVVEVLLRYRCDANVCDTNKRSALYNATLKGYTAIVKMLLEHNCNPDLCNNENKSPLLLATHLGHIDIVKLLLEHNCNTNIVDRDMISALHMAVAVNNKEITKMLLKHKCDMYIRSKFHESALYIACRYGRTDIVKLLLQNKCNPDLCEWKGESSLFSASIFGHTETVKLLLQYSIKSDLLYNNILTALNTLKGASGGDNGTIKDLLLNYKKDF
ncbi:serine/threonine-protein phosphatase 6 regulatory ankyrin repeat subunit B-like [Mytilus edulis]|uniref:serine/threonine-protein phosphatase 6 regulatory ankyrin repeat subunit B-like n=1 Tax=Mytilus edulis TaxID=6550 RepID=UPI0039EE2C11